MSTKFIGDIKPGSITNVVEIELIVSITINYNTNNTIG